MSKRTDKLINCIRTDAEAVDDEILELEAVIEDLTRELEERNNEIKELKKDLDWGEQELGGKR